MQIGIFSDVHGDLDGLLRVWSALDKAGLTEQTVLNGGDNVGYGPSPEACIAFMRDRPQIVCVRGNYDANVAVFPDREADFRAKWKRSRPEKYRAIREDSDAISKDARRWLCSLPKEARVAVGGRTILLTHYAPGAKMGIFPETPEPVLAVMAQAARADVVACGHTHVPFVRCVGGVMFVNPGAVGRGNGSASFAILDLPAGEPPSARLFRI